MLPATYLWYCADFCNNFSERPSSSSNCSVGSTITGLGDLKGRNKKKKTENPSHILTPAHDVFKRLPISKRTYVVSKRAPSAQRSRAFLAAGLLANSTTPLPVGLPRSSTTTTALSTGPNCENACSRSSLVTTGERFRTVRAAPCVANRMRIGLFLSTVPSNSALAISANVLDSFKKKKKRTRTLEINYTW